MFVKENPGRKNNKNYKINRLKNIAYTVSSSPGEKWKSLKKFEKLKRNLVKLDNKYFDEKKSFFKPTSAKKLILCKFWFV